MSGVARVVTLHPAADEPEDADSPALRAVPLPALDRVGVVLVAHSQELAEAAARLAVTLLGTGDPGPVATAGGTLDGEVGTSAARIVTAARAVDQGMGVAVLADLNGAVEAVRRLLADAEAHGLPFPVRLADAPFVEGAVAAVATAATGGDLAAVVEAAEDNYRVHKL